jgi:hypothetical protein
MDSIIKMTKRQSGLDLLDTMKQMISFVKVSQLLLDLYNKDHLLHPRVFHCVLHLIRIFDHNIQHNDIEDTNVECIIESLLETYGVSYCDDYPISDCEDCNEKSPFNSLDEHDGMKIVILQDRSDMKSCQPNLLSFKNQDNAFLINAMITTFNYFYYELQEEPQDDVQMDLS